MAEFCLECLKKFEPNANTNNTTVSIDPYLCEGCGQLKPVVLTITDKTCGQCSHFLGMGDWNLCCDLPHPECPMGHLCYENTTACEKFEPIEKLTEKEFYEKYCRKCGSLRCEGMKIEWFDGCQYKRYLQ